MFVFFFFNDTATTEIYTLSLHDALPISRGHPGDTHRTHRGRGRPHRWGGPGTASARRAGLRDRFRRADQHRSEEHTSELQSQSNIVCRLLLEKKKKQASARLERGV